MLVATMLASCCTTSSLWYWEIPVSNGTKAFSFLNAWCFIFTCVCAPSLVQRAVYKDIVLLLQKEKYLSAKQLKTKVSARFNGLLGCLFPLSRFIVAGVLVA